MQYIPALCRPIPFQMSQKHVFLHSHCALQNHCQSATQSNNARHPNRSRHPNRTAPHVDLLPRELERRIVCCRRTIPRSIPAIFLHTLLTHLGNIRPRPVKTPAQNRTAHARWPIWINRPIALGCNIVPILYYRVTLCRVEGVLEGRYI